MVTSVREILRPSLAALVLACTLVAGCAGAPEASSGPGPAAPSAPSSPAPSSPTPSDTASPVDPDEAACRRHAAADGGVRALVDAIEAGPVLPVGLALFLLAPRQAYAVPGTQDPELAAAMAEVVAAIDDLDAQGKVQLAPDGNPAQDAVQLDAARLDAALDALDQLCATV